jgi:transcription elongation GreA/GreB family factor
MTKTMDKKKILSEIIAQMEAELPELISAAQATYDAATNEESKPENEYDTRGLEASYLAGAQAKRIGEIEECLHVFKNLEVRTFSETEAIASTAMIEAQSDQGKKFLFFLLPKGGGKILQFDNKSIQVVTPSSPLGESLLTLKVGDSAIVEKAHETREYEILKIW